MSTKLKTDPETGMIIFYEGPFSKMIRILKVASISSSVMTLVSLPLVCVFIDGSGSGSGRECERDKHELDAIILPCI